MRNKIQKYLSGDHEGFSLVELIIVIAIMAILIGVVALAVLPYLEKSRESKDVSMLDTINSALAASVASTQVKGSGSFAWGDATTGDAAKVSADMLDTVGGGKTDFNSSALKDLSGCKIWCVYDAANNTIKTFAGTASNKVATFKRTTTDTSRTAADINGLTLEGTSSSDVTKAAIVTN